MKERKLLPDAAAAEGASAVPPAPPATNVVTRDRGCRGWLQAGRGALAGGTHRAAGERVMARMQSAGEFGHTGCRVYRGVPVLDRTGLTGAYDFVLDYVTDTEALAMDGGAAIPEAQAGKEPPRQGTTPGAPPSLVRCIEQQLGLKFESRKGPLDRLRRPIT